MKRRYAIVDLGQLEEDVIAQLDRIANTHAPTDEIRKFEAMQEFEKLTKKYIVNIHED